MKKITLFLAAVLISMTAFSAKLYLTPNANWKIDNARFAAYFFGNGEKWVSMTKVAGETDLYEVEAPAGYPSVIFCRMNPSASANNWNNKWNQTSDLQVPTNTQNHYTVKEGTWDKGGGTWTVYAPEAPKTYKDITITITANAQPKIHYWEGGDKMVGSDWESKPDMIATTEANTYSYTIKDVDAATGVKYLIVVGDFQSVDLHTIDNVTANFKECLPQVAVMGVRNWDGTDKMVVADDYKTASIALNLTAKDYAWKLTVNSEWFGGSKYVITRDKNSLNVTDDAGGDGKLTADIAGEYVFTYTYATKNLTVTYPAIPAVPTIVEGTKLYVQTPFEKDESASRPHKVVFGNFTVPTGGTSGGGLKMAASTVTEVAMTKVYTEVGQYSIWEVTAPAGTQDSIFNVIVYRQSNPYAYITPLKYDGEKNLFKLPNDYSPQSTKTGIIPATEADGEWDIYVPDYTGGDATSVENATVANIFVQNGMIVMDGEYQIYTITGQNVTGMNGSLENGIYIVKSLDSAVKVIVK